MDQLRVLQILINLLSNAIKFSPRSSQILIEVLPKENDSDSCYYDVSVIDKGIGMSASDVNNLFKPYFRTSDKASRELNMNSHGLGLSISMSIAKILGCNILV